MYGKGFVAFSMMRFSRLFIGLGVFGLVQFSVVSGPHDRMLHQEEPCRVESPCEESVTVVRVGCAGGCASPIHHHHSKAHHPYTCPTCRAFHQPFLMPVASPGPVITVSNVTRPDPLEVFRLVLRVVTPPLRAPPVSLPS